MVLSKQDIEDRIVEAMRKHFLKFSDEVIEKYKHQIDSTIRWYISSLPRHIAKHEADDLASEAKIAFIESLKTWDPRYGELWSYVSVRLKGAMQDYLRKRGNDPVAGIYEWVTSAANVYMAFNKDLIQHDHMDKILHAEAAMSILEDKERAVVEGYYKRDKTFKQIGEEIGLSESQVSRICKESTIKMRKVLKKSEEEECKPA